MSLLRRLLGLKGKDSSTIQTAQTNPIPARPPDWTLTIDDLLEQLRAGERDSIGSPEREWALDYQRSLLPEETRFPRHGDVYESIQHQTISYITTWSAPYSGDGSGQLLAGDRIWINDHPEHNGDEQTLGCYALALDYAGLEQRMVPAETRNSHKYTGFQFYFTTADLNARFKLVETNYLPGER